MQLAHKVGLGQFGQGGSSQSAAALDDPFEMQTRGFKVKHVPISALHFP